MKKTERIKKRHKEHIAFDQYIEKLDKRVRKGEITGKDPFPDPNPPKRNDEDGLD